MFIIKIADINIAIYNTFDYLKKFCSQYIIESDRFDFSVSVSTDEIEHERSMLDFDADDGFIESICIYREIAKKLPDYNAFVIHCAAIEYNGFAYCFAAKSGTGKTTHIKLWRQTFGEMVHIINGDKPIMRFINDRFYVYGTPWSGKENFNNNVSFPLKSICFLEQAEVNQIFNLTKFDSLNRICQQIFLPKSTIGLGKTIDLIDKLLSDTKIYSLKCNISPEAAILSKKVMCEE